MRKKRGTEEKGVGVEREAAKMEMEAGRETETSGEAAALAVLQVPGKLILGSDSIPCWALECWGVRSDVTPACGIVPSSSVSRHLLDLCLLLGQQTELVHIAARQGSVCRSSCCVLCR